MKFQNLFKKTSKIENILAAIPLCFFGVLITGICILFLYFIFPELPNISAKSRNPFIFSIFFLPIGIGCLIISWRLITGKNRRIDGGLLPPSIILIFGLFFLFAPLYFFWIHHSMALETVTFFMSAAACFILAKVRRDSIKKR